MEQSEPSTSRVMPKPRLTFGYRSTYLLGTMTDVLCSSKSVKSRHEYFFTPRKRKRTRCARCCHFFCCAVPCVDYESFPNGSDVNTGREEGTTFCCCLYKARVEPEEPSEVTVQTQQPANVPLAGTGISGTGDI